MRTISHQLYNPESKYCLNFLILYSHNSPVWSMGTCSSQSVMCAIYLCDTYDTLAATGWYICLNPSKKSSMVYILPLNLNTYCMALGHYKYLNNVSVGTDWGLILTSKGYPCTEMGNLVVLQLEIMVHFLYFYKAIFCMIFIAALVKTVFIDSYICFLFTHLVNDLSIFSSDDEILHLERLMLKMKTCLWFTRILTS